MGSAVEGVVQSSDVKVVERPSSWTVQKPYDVLLRLMGLCLTLVATIIVGVDKETKTISFAGMHFQATAKWEYMSSSVFFLATNAIACSYAAASLVFSTSMARRSSTTGHYYYNMAYVGVTMMDLLITALLFSANGAAAAVGVIGMYGNSHVQWMRVCNVFDAYCRHQTAALVLSLLGSSVFLFMVLLSIVKLHHKST